MNKRKIAFLTTMVVGLCSCAFSSANADMLPPTGDIPISFPEIEDFSKIEADFQSVDPSLYNFQMWCTRDGFYAYIIQNLEHPEFSKSDSWKNSHTELLVYNGDFGYGWGGTYFALFPNGTMYINNKANLQSYFYKVQKTINGDITTLEYYFCLNFVNNGQNIDPAYAYVKPFQFLPNETYVNSIEVTRDNRKLLTGDEVSFQVHEKIDKKMYE